MTDSTIILSEDSDVNDIFSSVVERYFPNRNISVGGMCRKLQWVLIDLTNTTRKGWELRVYHFRGEHKCAFEFVMDGEKKILVVLTNILSTTANTQKLIDAIFDRDKYLDVPVVSATITFLTFKGKVVFTKHRYPGFWTFSTVSKPTTTTERWRQFRHSFGDAHDDRIISAEVMHVVEDTLPINFHCWLECHALTSVDIGSPIN